jgi:RNA polymerase sigma factor (sigma-70 family)
LAQETFISAWRDLSQLKDMSKFKGWLSSIARNIIRNSFRSQKRDLLQKSVSLDQIQEDGVNDNEPSEAIITKEQQAVVRQALQQIPTKYRDPLVLFYRQEQSVKEVAKQLELSEEAVKQRLSRGRNMLKEQVAAIVETTIRRTGPSMLFTAAVVAAVPSIAPQVVSASIAATAAKGSLMAKSAPLISTMGWILGPLLGFVGAIVALRPDLKNTSRRERRFSIWTGSLQAAYSLVFITFSIALVIWWGLFLGRPLWPWPIIVICMVLMLLPGILFSIWTERRVKQIQIEDGTYAKPEWKTLTMTKGQIYGAFGGSIFGSLAWLFRITSAADDWGVFWVVLTAGILIFLIATKLCLRDPRHGFKIASGVFIYVGLLNLLAVNMRWDKWRYFLKDEKIPLAHINWLIGSVVVMLVLVAMIHDWRYQKMRKEDRCLIQ